MIRAGAPACVAEPLAGPEIDALFAGWQGHRHIALGVSGGADSMSLMMLAHAWLGRMANPPRISILTVDHRLRPQAAEEAAWVKAEAARLGLPHEILVWEGPKPSADIQAAAREARYGLMLEFCRDAGVDALATAHNAEDQAETLIMRLARGSGLDGLAAISPVTLRGHIALLRPLLAISRMRLEATLLAHGQIWLDDPSNHDRHFERVRLRETLRANRDLQLTPEKLALSARRLDRARDALERITGAALRAALRTHPAGFGDLDRAALLAEPEEIAIRMLTRLAATFGGGRRPVRLARVEALHAAISQPRPGVATLGGCVFTPRGPALRMRRECGRIDPARLPLPETGALTWDGRFAVSAPEPAGLTVGALGPAGLAILRAAGGRTALPGQIVHAIPALWRGERLVFAPFAVFADKYPAGWTQDARAVFIGGERLARRPDMDGEAGPVR